MRKLASIVTIDKVTPIENSDRLSVATMKGKGWKVVVGREDFKEGDHAVYFEIDSYLPNEDRYGFLRERCLRRFMTKDGQTCLKEGLRIKTMKLRGVISQGLLIPMDKFPEIEARRQYDKDGTLIGILLPCEMGDGTPIEKTMTLEGADVTNLLNVEHYDEVKAALVPEKGTSVNGDAFGSFPSFIPKTDEERIQNLADYFTDENLRDREFEVTEKQDGSSVTFFYAPSMDPENPFGVCSRNIRLKPEKADGTKPLPWQMTEKYDIEGKLRKEWENSGREYAVQGELVGPGIQANRDMFAEHEWHCFRIWDITGQEFMGPHETVGFCAWHDIPHVPVLAHMKVFERFRNVGELLAFAEGKTTRGNEREGLVFKAEGKPYLSFKAVSNRYLLKQAAKED